MTDTSDDKHDVTDIRIESTSSVNALRSAKPSENITVLDKIPSSEEKIEKIHEEPTFVESRQKVETFFQGNLEDAPSLVHNAVIPNIEKQFEDRIEHNPDGTQLVDAKGPYTDREALINNASERKDMEYPSRDEISGKPFANPTSLDKKIRVSAAPSGICQSERIIRNQSDIFALKEEVSMASAIFSVNGSPSRKVVRRKELIASNVFPFGQIVKDEPPSEKLTSPRDKIRDTKESYNDLKRPSSSARNPLTGTGLSSNDEYKFKGAKRKDGNPLLGLGYSPEATPSAHRIPPGGYSHKLW